MGGDGHRPAPDEPEDAPRAALRAAADWAADYLAGSERFPVLSRLRPGELRSAFPEAAPESGQSLEALLEAFRERVLPGITHWNHPGFMAYFANTGSAPGVVAELLCAALNVNGMLWRTSPAATELEELSLDWLRQMLGLDAGWRGIIADTASMSSLLALAAARQRAVPELRDRGSVGRPDLGPLAVYASEEAHSSIDKACLMLGLGLRHLRKIPVDAEFRMDVRALESAIARDVTQGVRPMAVVATVGTTSTTSIDNVAAIARLCRPEGLWLHVDAAYGGAAAVADDYRHVLDGVDGADSLVVNPHKWLLVPMDCSALFLRDPSALPAAFSLRPEYLRPPGAAPGVEGEGDEEPTDYMDWGVQLGRRFRALKLWMVLAAYGRQGLAAHVREHCRLARLLASWIDSEPGWERMAPVPFSTVVFRHRPGGLSEAALERVNTAILGRVNAGGEIFLSHTRLGRRFALRLTLGNERSAERHLARAWQLLREAAETGGLGGA